LIKASAAPTLLLLLASAGTASAAAQETGSLGGRVVEAETGRPLLSAQVFIPGTGAGTLTDQSGEFVLEDVPPGQAVVRVELVGYGTLEKGVTVASGQTASVDFELRPEIFQLDEVVVTGTAGMARRREVGHAISTIVPDQAAEPVATMDNLLAAQAPGLVVLPSSGMAGSGAQIRLRGNVSVALSNQPLIYVDGVRIRSDGYPKNVPPSGPIFRGPNDVPSPLNDINPDDVERVEVIKGPAATTLYGVEGASGVIQIFTKRGSPGRPQWQAVTHQSFDDVQEFGTDREPYMGIDPWLGTAWRQKYGLSVGGGSDMRYYISGAYEDNEGVLPNDWENRFGLRGNFDFSPLDGLQVAWNSSYTKRDISNTPAGNNAHGLTSNAFQGEQNSVGGASKEIIDQVLDYEIFTYIDHLTAGVTASYAPNDGFTNRLTVGYDRAENELRQLRPFGFVLAPQGILSTERWASGILSLDYVGSLEHRLRPGLLSTLSWGGQRIISDVTSVAGYAEDFPGPGEPTLSSGAQTLAFERRSHTENWGLFSQLMLGYRDRLFLTTGLRLDGYSAFGDDVGLQPYPRISLSYVVSEEPYWRKAWGTLKLRAAYGHAGRAPGPFDADRTWRAVGFVGDPAFVPDKVGNPELGPERTSEAELGFDGSFFNDRLTADFSFYERRTTDALFPVTQIPSLGFLNTQLENVGRLRNRGVELALGGTLVRDRDFGWDAGVYLATSHSKVLDLGEAPDLFIDPVGWILEGQPAPVLRGTRVENPDEIAEPRIQENAVFGPSLPTHTLGFHTTLRLPRGIEVTARGEYLGGHYIFDDTSRSLATRGSWPVCAEAYQILEAGERDRLTAWERVYCDPRSAPSDGPIYPADFFRLRDVSVTVPLPRLLPQASNVTLIVAARNYLSWKNRDVLVFDPEMAGPDGMHTPIRHTSYHVPPPASLTASLRVLF
jgi:TonB-dependent SusC/RagA subfamily outer membrane receptor